MCVQLLMTCSVICPCLGSPVLQGLVLALPLPRFRFLYNICFTSALSIEVHCWPPACIHFPLFPPRPPLHQFGFSLCKNPLMSLSQSGPPTKGNARSFPKQPLTCVSILRPHQGNWAKNCLWRFFPFLCSQPCSPVGLRMVFLTVMEM